MDPQIVLDNLEQLSDREARGVATTALRNLVDRGDSGMPITSEDIAIFVNIAADGRLAANAPAQRPPAKDV
jgi:hypothetical protein